MDQINDLSSEYGANFQTPQLKTAQNNKKSVRNPTKRAITLDATHMYLDAIGLSPLLTAEQEVEYARCVIQGDSAARTRMIECNLRLIVSIAKRY